MIIMPACSKMLLFELFGSGEDMMDEMRQDALDVIMPFLAQDVPFVTVNQVIDGLKGVSQTSIAVDRNLVMQLLDPNIVKAVSKIEGDRVYLSQPEDATREVSDKDEEKDQENMKKLAQAQAEKNIQNR